jgi:hypothetical protein
VTCTTLSTMSAAPSQKRTFCAASHSFASSPITPRPIDARTAPVIVDDCQAYEGRRPKMRLTRRNGTDFAKFTSSGTIRGAHAPPAGERSRNLAGIRK